MIKEIMRLVGKFYRTFLSRHPIFIFGWLALLVVEISYSITFIRWGIAGWAVAGIVGLLYFVLMPAFLASGEAVDEARRHEDWTDQNKPSPN